MHRTPLQLLHGYGQSPWLEVPSRQGVKGGELERLVRDHGIRGLSADLALSDAREACDLLRPIWDHTEGGDGHASISVDPSLVERPNLMVKFPPTPAGLAALEDAVAAGISADATPIFSLARYEEVARAYICGLERLVAAGGSPGAVSSVATLHVSPVDAVVDGRLAAIGGSALKLRGRLGIANAKLAHQRQKEIFGSRPWELFAARGARPQRCRWASTSGEAAGYCEVIYVEELIGGDSVTSLAPCTLWAFEDHGVVADNLERGLDEARRLFDDLRTAGVDLDDVWRTLESRLLPRL